MIIFQVQIIWHCAYKDTNHTLCKWNRGLVLLAGKTFLPHLYIFCSFLASFSDFLLLVQDFSHICLFFIFSLWFKILLIFLGGAPTSICHFFCPTGRPSVCPSVHRAPYLRNRTLSDHNFWYAYVKWWYL